MRGISEARGGYATSSSIDPSARLRLDSTRSTQIDSLYRVDINILGRTPSSVAAYTESIKRYIGEVKSPPGPYAGHTLSHGVMHPETCQDHRSPRKILSDELQPRVNPDQSIQTTSLLDDSDPIRGTLTRADTPILFVPRI